MKCVARLVTLYMRERMYATVYVVRNKSTSNSSKHLVHIILQVCDSLLSTLILVAPRLK